MDIYDWTETLILEGGGGARFSQILNLPLVAEDSDQRTKSLNVV